MASSTNSSPQIGSHRSVGHKRGSSVATGTTALSEPGESPTSVLYEPPWDRQCVLSLDGGGIRGYSSLIILRRVMREVKRIETRDLSEDHKDTHSSYHPGEYIHCVDNSHDEVPVTGVTGGTDGQGEKIGDRKATCGECCRYLPCHYFDYVGGTSTGGLIAIMLGKLRMSVDKCIEEYQKLSGDIFGHPRLASVRGPIPWLRDKYDGKIIQRAVEDVVERRMSKAQRQIGAGNFNSAPGLCRTVVFAYAQKISKNTSEYGSSGKNKKCVEAELPNSAPYILRSYDHWGADPPYFNERNPGIAHSIPIWEAARATTAAPFYFEPIEISNHKFGDGGFGTNNPAAEMFWEVTYMNGKDPNCFELLLSIGTGESTISRFENGPLAKYLGYLNAARQLASDSAAVHTQMEGFKGLWKIPYHRFNVSEKFGLGKMKLDEWKQPSRFSRCKESTLQKIERVTEAYCDQEDIAKELEKVAEILVRHRKARMESDLWNLVSTGLQYRCTVEKCRRCQQLHPRRKDLEMHLINKHQLEADTLEKVLTKGKCPPPKVE